MGQALSINRQCCSACYQTIYCGNCCRCIAQYNRLNTRNIIKIIRCKRRAIGEVQGVDARTTNNRIFTGQVHIKDKKIITTSSLQNIITSTGNKRIITNAS